MTEAKKDAESVDFGILNELIGYRLRRAQLTFFSSFASTCADLGISPGLFGVLEIVRRNPGLTQTSVAQALGNDRSAMVAAVDKLEKMNLIERRPSKKDRRSYALYMTDYGSRWYTEAEQRVRGHEASFDNLLEAGEKEWLLDILARLSAPGDADKS